MKTNKHGFTLVEILTAVIIVTILVVMAVPLYEKTIERSRLAEARTVMHNLQTAKLDAMASMYCGDTFDKSTCPVKLKHLRVAINKNAASVDGYTFSTDAFQYSISPTTSGYQNGICAKRLGGENDGVIFLQVENDGTRGGTFLCNASDNAICDYYGMNNSAFSCDF